MHLKRLEIFGFKSFADKTNLEFKNGITAIVGPNGSGKSNVSDAIKWVLGEQKIKTLRGSKMEDVIFSGTEARKPLGVAEVSLIIDNHSGSFPIEYSEISVTRRLYRSGESEYYINKSPCRLKDVLDLFADTGLGKEGYSIIGQGKIDHIVSSNSQERRLLIEEAAGIVKFKNRKLESQRKLEKTQDNLYRIGDIILELEKQIPTLKKQSEKAFLYLELREKLKRVELNLFVHQVDELQRVLKELEQNANHIQEELSRKSEEISLKDKAYQKLRGEVEFIDEELKKVNEQYFALNEAHQKNNTDVQMSTIKIENNQDKISSLERLNKETEELNHTLNQKIESIKLSISSIDGDLKEEKNQIRSLQEEKSQYELRIRSQQQIYIEKKDSIDKTDKKISDTLSKLALLENKDQYTLDHLADLQRRVDECSISIQEASVSIEEEKKKQDKLSEDINSLKRQYKEKKERLVKAQEKSHALSSELKFDESQYNKLHSKYNLMNSNEDFLGYQHSVKNLLREKKKNKFLSEHLHDVVGNILEVPKRYALAIETSLGSTVHHLIVENENAAHECIKILNTNKWGRATFLPLNIVKGQVLKLEPKIVSHKGFIDLGSNLIEFDKKYNNIVYNLLGKVLIVEDITAAKEISKLTFYKYKIVTLNGEIFFPGGAIVGGVHKNKTTSIIQRKQEVMDLEFSMKTLQEKIKSCEKENDGLKEFVEQGNVEIASLEKNLNRLHTEEKLVKQICEQLNSKVCSELKNKSSLQIKIDEIHHQRAKEEENIEDLKKILASTQIEKESLGDVNQFKVDDQIQETIDKLDEKILQIKLSIAKAEERYNYYQTQREDFIHTLEENTHKVLLNKEEMDKLILDNKELEKIIEEANRQINQLEKAKSQLRESMESHTEEKKNKNHQIDHLQEKIKELNKENVLINESYNKMVNKVENKTAELEQLENNIFEDYQVNYAMAKEYYYEIESLNAEMKILKSYKTQIKDLGSVNVDSVEQYKEVKERYEFLTLQRDDLTKAKDSLHEIIEEITVHMEGQFVEQFELIKKEFDCTFTKLFNGGTAKLILEDSNNIMETGIDIEVQPPGKKLKNISLLSGGEKSLTAIALLFAIINIKPTPFCILDEIDAALDDSNVDRFSKYLYNVSKENQFITITHRKGTMEIADRLYGISMNKDGVSKIVSVEMSHILENEVNV
ncbi:condensin subunit Smc [Alkalibaculum bacchi]|uniref:Chromosome partition protein Smc n=1 Tax=Alkalibaculum bacchi TaxID=645887 RepID=A0A366IBX9_9FIRM|nr:chromosome segregation protein SMC [Alkalibaculum bacchi]RBP68275.1 condensin subunit Smc [Alkalibaculum bacchi]